MRDFPGIPTANEAGLNPGQLLEAVESLIAGSAPGRLSVPRRRLSDPLTPREIYALSLVAELIAALNDGSSAHEPRRVSRKFVFGDVTLDVRRREVRESGRLVHLTPKEYDLLLALAQESGAPVSKEKLRKTIWKDSIRPESRAIEQSIVELRRKLERDPRRPRYIRIARKFGYRLDGEWVDEEAA